MRGCPMVCVIRSVVLQCVSQRCANACDRNAIAQWQRLHPMKLKLTSMLQSKFSHEIAKTA